MNSAALSVTASALLLGVAMFSGTAGANAAVSPAPVGLGTATSYSVLGGTAVTNTGPTTMSGDLGVNPGTAVTGFPPGIFGGTLHAADAPALQAQSDLTAAYNDAASRASTAIVAGDLVGQTLVAGVYKSNTSVDLSGVLTLDGQGDPSSVFIFQVGSTLNTASASSVNLINGASACNVYWQVGSSATLGTTSDFKGTIMSLSSISLTTGATVEGRALARNGAVTLDTNVLTAPICAAPVVVTPAPVVTTPPVTTPPTSAAPVVSAPVSSVPISSTPVSGTPSATPVGGSTPTGVAGSGPGSASGSYTPPATLANTSFSEATDAPTVALTVLGALLLAGSATLLLSGRIRAKLSRKH
jgi:type VI secretion system secreted protein VgrG